MSEHSAEPRGTSASREVLTRQLIVVALALCVISMGIWTLLKPSAPYHPESFGATTVYEPDGVSRDDTALIAAKD